MIDTIHEYTGGEGAEVTVAISLHNYGHYIVEALRSVYLQTMAKVEIIVVDDASTDDGAERTARWMRRNAHRFVRALLVCRETNCGLAASRNRAIELSQSPLFFVLDADNLLYPRCLDRLSSVLNVCGDAAFAYPILEMFGEGRGLMGTDVWSRERLAGGNYIDAMSMIRAERLRELGGYRRMEVTGWEDYELWCRFAEHGWQGVRVPEILARYRVHGSSMLNTITRRRERAPLLAAEMRRLHPWLQINP